MPRAGSQGEVVIDPWALHGLTQHKHAGHHRMASSAVLKAAGFSATPFAKKSERE
jgi:hypothetical protein